MYSDTVIDTLTHTLSWKLPFIFHTIAVPSNVITAMSDLLILSIIVFCLTFGIILQGNTVTSMDQNARDIHIREQRLNSLHAINSRSYTRQ